MKKHLATENPYLSSFLCLDCYFGKMLDNRQFEKKEDLDIGLVLYVQM